MEKRNTELLGGKYLIVKIATLFLLKNQHVLYVTGTGPGIGYVASQWKWSAGQGEYSCFALRKSGGRVDLFR